MFSIGCSDIAVSGQVFRAGLLCALLNRIVVSSVSFAFVCEIKAMFVHFVRFFV